MSHGEVSTGVAGSGARVASVCVAVTLASLALGVVPVTRLALVASPAVSLRLTFTLSTGDVAEVIQRTYRVAVAGCNITVSHFRLITQKNLLQRNL